MAFNHEERTSIQDYICQEIALGRSLVSICASGEKVGDIKVPGYTTVMRWREEDEDFREKYARAREDQADFHADKIVDIADTATDANVARLQIDARKWAAGKLKPKVYGDRLQLDADMRVNLTDEQLNARAALLIGKARTDLIAGGDRASEGPQEVLRDVSGDGASQA